MLSSIDSEIVIMDVNKSRIRHKILFTSRFQSLFVSNQNLKSITVVADLSFGKGFIFPLYILPINANCFAEFLS